VLLGDVTDQQIIALTQKTYSGRLEMGEDLMTIDIGPEIKVRRPSDRSPSPGKAP
jgi:hypothetical protein